ASDRPPRPRGLRQTRSHQRRRRHRSRDRIRAGRRALAPPARPRHRPRRRKRATAKARAARYFDYVSCPSMIDCHAHAFPDLAYHAAKLPGPLGDAVGMVAPALTSLVQRLGGSKSRFSTEKVAAMRKKGPRALHRVTEIAGSLAMAPGVMASGTVEKLVESMDRHGIARTLVIA